MANHLHVCPGNKYANRYDKIYAGLDTAKTTLNIESWRIRVGPPWFFIHYNKKHPDLIATYVYLS
mgnify:FL=1